MSPETIGKKYDKVAAWWHENHLNSSYGIEAVSRAIRYCRQKRNALDAGCGSGGRMIQLLRSHGFQIKGVDVSSKMLEIAKRNHPEVVFELSDISIWDTDEKFDLILAWDSLFHLSSEKQEPVISKICRKLVPQGILIYTFGDTPGDHEDLSFRDSHGNQAGELHQDLFGYGSIGIQENLRVIHENHCQCLHLELDQYPHPHVYLIARKNS